MDLFTGTLLAVTALYAGIALAFVIGLFRLPAGQKEHAQPFISVVIAARNEAAFIGQVLQDLSRQTYPPEHFEVLVVDDDSQDETRTIVADAGLRAPNIRCLPVGTAFPRMAAKKRPMSVGIKAARGEIILTTDADCRMPSTWVEGMAAGFEPGVDVVIGFSQIKQACSACAPFERLQAFDFLTLMSAAAGAAGIGFPLAATGQNLAYRKALFEQVGGFQRIGHRPSGDDVLLLQLMRREGKGRIIFSAAPGTFVSTWRTETVASFWQQRRRWASNAIYQACLNPAFFVYIIVVFLINLLAPLGLILSAEAGGRFLSGVCWGTKILADMAVIWTGARRFARTDLLRVLPAWEILQPPYTVLVGLFGTLGGFRWKDRYHRQV